MSRFVKVKKARKNYRCDNFGTYAHDATIRPGDLYARISEAPRGKGEPWAYDILCKVCWDHEVQPWK